MIRPCYYDSSDESTKAPPGENWRGLFGVNKLRFRAEKRAGVTGTANLTDKQKRLVDEYLVDLNKTQAAIRAGYSAKTADRIAQNTLQKPLVQQYLQQRQRELAERTQVTKEKVIRELAMVAFANGTDFAKVKSASGRGEYVELVDTDDLPPEKRAAIAGIEETKFGIKVTACDKVRALELLGKYLGAFDGRGNPPEAGEGNMLDAIVASTEEDLCTDDLPEL